MVDTYVFLKKTRNPETSKALETILTQLEKERTSITSNHTAARVLAQRLRPQKNFDSPMIYFSWNSRWNKSVISLAPGYRLVRPTKSHVKFVYETSPESKTQ